ncbi:Tyr recombinase domain-containing protein [Gammaproteobacteria bacterium]
MGRKRTPGLFKRGESWHVDKQVFGQRIRESTGSNSLEEAEKYLARRIEGLRQVAIYGARPKRTFREAATKFLKENQHKRSIGTDAVRLKELDKHIGDLYIDNIHMGTLQSFIEARKKDSRKTQTINHELQIVRHILNLAADEWRDNNNLTWLHNAPKIKLLPKNDVRKPFPLSWEEQEQLFKELPPHLKRMALFAANTGCRDQEICSLKWDWEVKIPEFNTSIFVIPGVTVKNGEDRLVVLNKIALSVINEVRGQHYEYVFTYAGKPTSRMLNSAWKRARKRANLAVRVHDLKHTFGRRLRAAGVSFEDRQDLLGHKSGRITTHYSAAEIGNLIAAANKVCRNKLDFNSPTLTLLRCANPGSMPVRIKVGNAYVGQKINLAPTKPPQFDLGESCDYVESHDRSQCACSSVG